jgi:2-hydroxychromene-2-carboxylate isomerase
MKTSGASMHEQRSVGVYIDYKSPYAFLAKDLVYELEREFPVRIDWLPYTLDIPSFLGSAKVDDNGRVIEEQRNPHQWRRVRYSYMDCRRQARKRGLVIRGPQKIWDSTVALQGMLYAKRQRDAVLRCYHDIVFERFWKRELDIENPEVIRAGSQKPAQIPRRFPAIWPDRVLRTSTKSAGLPRPRECSACRLLSWRASSSGAASTCPTFARCSKRLLIRTKNEQWQ